MPKAWWQCVKHRADKGQEEAVVTAGRGGHQRGGRTWSLRTDSYQNRRRGEIRSWVLRTSLPASHRFPSSALWGGGAPLPSSPPTADTGHPVRTHGHFMSGLHCPRGKNFRMSFLGMKGMPGHPGRWHLVVVRRLSSFICSLGYSANTCRVSTVSDYPVSEYPGTLEPDTQAPRTDRRRTDIAVPFPLGLCRSLRVRQI